MSFMSLLQSSSCLITTAKINLPCSYLLQCREAYDYSVDNIYQHLVDYPLLNINARNCRLGATCADYTRTSDDADALAVFPGILGQKLAIYSDSSDLEVFIGTSECYTLYSTKSFSLMDSQTSQPL